MAILVGIDGTGVISRLAYARDMSNSFVNYICRRSLIERKDYRRGPGWDGIDTAAIASQAYTFVHLAKVANPDDEIFLTGYSRGGSAVIDVARRLQRDRLQVTGMMLFDAVDRSFTSSGQSIPSNVVRAYHAVREWNSFSRGSFGNCGRTSQAPTKYEEMSFMCTHGGMGGVPWRCPPGVRSTQYINEGFPESTPTLVTYQMDLAGSRLVWAWAEPRLRQMGFFGRH